MGTDCYAMVRGSSIRVSGLGSKGSIPHPIPFAVSKSVVKVQINEVTTSGSDELLGSDENDNDNRVRLLRPDQTLHYTVDIDFLRVDPGVLALITGTPQVNQIPGVGFGRGYFGESPFGGEAPGTDTGFGGDAFGEDEFGAGGEPDEPLTVIGFDAATRHPPASFALEVWSKLAGRACAEGTKQYGYTVFPHLRGGHLTGFKFDKGLVSFNIRGAQTRREPRWGVGLYDLEGPHERLLSVVSRNALFRQTLTTAVPPTEMNGIQETTDVIYGGTATVTSDDVIDGGDAASTSQWIIYGGRAV